MKSVSYIDSGRPLPWLTARTDGEPEPCLHVSDLFLTLIPACGLSWGAGWTYIAMGLEAKGKNEVCFSPSVARRYGIRKKDLPVYIKALTRGGYIQQTGKFRGHPHVYTITEADNETN